MTRIFIFRIREGRGWRGTEDVDQAVRWLEEAGQLTPEYERQLRADYAVAHPGTPKETL